MPARASTWVAPWAIWSLATFFPHGITAAPQFQQGDFVVKTISVSPLTADSATACTATSGTELITTTVPVWQCTDCPTPYNAIFASPVTVWGPPGVPSPPPGYPVCFLNNSRTLSMHANVHIRH